MSKYFPPVEKAQSDGLLFVGGKLTPDWLTDAYTHGIFPWPSEDFGSMLWFSPDPRAILPLDTAHFSRRLLRTIHSKDWVYRINKSFENVIRGCAAPREDDSGTWITEPIIQAYCRLHKLGIAHSFEVWKKEDDGNLSLIGGTYGVAYKHFFAAESKFHTETDASKAALWFLVQVLKAYKYKLLDVQFQNSHIQQFGVTEIPRSEYMKLLADALKD